jgi:uncharacterized SAM-binding protein YcdF (DUF218 family)
MKPGWMSLIEAALMPPALPLLIALSGLCVGVWRRVAGTLVVVAGLGLLAVAALPVTAQWLHVGLAPGRASASGGEPPGAIVILGGGSYAKAPEYGGDTVNHVTLERVRFGARLARETGLPVLVSGGDPLGLGSSEARQMRAVLEREFGVKVQWEEGESLTTRDNARRSAEMLHAARIETVWLVTHAWHMRRARDAFERTGLSVRPAPTGFPASSPARWTDWVPSAGALESTRVALHERLGFLWYRLTQTEQ